MKIGLLARQMLIKAYGEHPEMQSETYDEVARYIGSGSLEQYRIHTPSSTTTLASGGRGVRSGCRIHNGRDWSPGSTPLLHQAIAFGEIVIADEVLHLPAGAVPASSLLRIKQAMSAGEIIALGDIVDIDDKLSQSVVSSISQSYSATQGIVIPFTHPDYWTVFDDGVGDDIAKLQRIGEPA